MIELVEHDDALEARSRGQLLFRYVHRPSEPQLESPKPYLHPIHDLAGELVSLYRPHDHVWHKGISWALPVVGPHNFWGGGDYVHEEGGYVQRDTNGSMQHQRFTRLDADGGVLAVEQELVWRSQAGAAVVAETRSLGARVLDDATWVLTFTSQMRNTSDEPLPIGSPTTKGRENAGYGGLFWRGPRSFTEGQVFSEGVAGSGEDVRGKRAAWCGFSGRHDGTDTSSGIVMVDAPGNPASPPQWFVRSEPFAALCPAPFFSEEVPFDPGTTRTFRYGVAVHAGALDTGTCQDLVQRTRDVLEGGDG